MKIIVAPDSFKGVLTAAEAAEAISSGLREYFAHNGLEMPTVASLPIADGGEGTAAACGLAAKAERIECDAVSPLGEPLRVEYFYDSSSRRAFIDLAAASGLPLVAAEERNPMRTSTFGTGLMMRHAIGLGVKTIVVGAGGSATIDGALGAMQALGVRFIDSCGKEIPSGASGASLPLVSEIIIPEGLHEAMPRIVVAADVVAPFSGEKGAARVFGPQKGASAADVENLEVGMRSFAAHALANGYRDAFSRPGSGAAGGFAGGLASILGAEICSGGSLVIKGVGLDSALSDASLLITGEGKSDSQTLMGKAPFLAMQRARSRGIPTVLLAGAIEDKEALHDAGFDIILNINSGFPAGDECLRPDVAISRLRIAAARIAGLRNELSTF